MWTVVGASVLVLTVIVTGLMRLSSTENHMQTQPLKENIIETFFLFFGAFFQQGNVTNDISLAGQNC